MTDSKNPWIEAKNHNESPKRRSFFGWEITEKTKDLLDFRYNTQEEIDKLNDEMTTASDLDEMIRQTQNNDSLENNENIENENEEYIREKDETEAESDLEENLQSFNESLNSDWINNNHDEVYQENDDEHVEWEIVENSNDNEENTDEETKEENIETIEIEEPDEINETLDEENEQEIESWESAKFFDPFELDVNDDEENSEWSNENFDPFELDESEIKNENEGENEKDVNEVELEDNSENKNINDETEDIDDESQDDEIKETPENEPKEDVDNIEENLHEEEWEDLEFEDTNEKESEKVEEYDETFDEWNTNDKAEENNNEGQIEEIEETPENEPKEDVNDKKKVWEIDYIIDQKNDWENDEEPTEILDENEENTHGNIQEEIINSNKENEDEDANEDIIINTPIVVNPNQKDKKEETPKTRKVKKNSATWEIITDEEIQLEQWQDTSNDEDDEDYQPTAEELFEYEPELFADDELSQQFIHLVQNVRGIFKLERKDSEQNPYFKILWWKTTNATLEYLFYLIEEEDEPIDLYIKKVETNQDTQEESEHLVQFSYNSDKELNIFVDEVILYEEINKSDLDAPEYNDTKAILEKFIFLTDNHYDKLKEEINKEREERQKKRQLQQIFKGF